MSKAARKLARRNIGAKPSAPKKNEPELRLQNPVAEHFASFIFGNATKCKKVVQQGSAKGKTLVICGAGPSLSDNLHPWIEDADEVWGCNSALIWMREHGHRVTHGFTVDQTPHMVQEWESEQDVPYLLATSVHPNLVEWLETEDRVDLWPWVARYPREGRDLTFFHNYVGIDRPPVAFGVCADCEAIVEGPDGACPKCGSEKVDRKIWSYEDWLYESLYPPTIRAGAGLNTASRAIDVGLAEGFDRITILGSDCCLRHTRISTAPMGSPEYMDWLRTDVIMHVDGSDALRSGATAMVMQAEIDGRMWITKPDMAITAVWLAEMARHHPDRLNFVGDTLINAIKDKPEEFFERLPALTNAKGERLRYTPNPDV